MSKEDMVSTLRGLLQSVLEARFSGVRYAKLARAHGYADGYMRALMDAGLLDKDEVLEVVCDERKRFVAA
ncbi:MAG: hypothetical protein AAGF12_26010 [Myxococcota bacterium]